MGGDIKDPRLLWLKAALFVVAGAMAATALMLEVFTWTRLFLLITIPVLGGAMRLPLGPPAKSLLLSQLLFLFLRDPPLY